MILSNPELVLDAAPIAALPAIALSLAVLLLGYGASRAARTSRQGRKQQQLGRRDDAEADGLVVLVLGIGPPLRCCHPSIE